MTRYRGEQPSERSNWRRRLFVIIFGHDTPAGKAFDVGLLVVILASVLVVLLESVPAIRAEHGQLLLVAEWAFTVLFTAEYLLRLICVRNPVRYATSFYGVVDLLAIVPTYLSVLVVGAQELMVIRALRLLRIFRILKLPEYLTEATLLVAALNASRRKITVFLASVLTLVLIVGALMHLIEGPEHGFTSIPISIYWAVVTLTTVGYGDIAPQTTLGRMLAGVVMIIGYGIIAVPTGIVTAELVSQERRDRQGRACGRCGLADHDADARHCKACGEPLPPRVTPAMTDGREARVAQPATRD